uniref:Chemokine interleukin-8-like domain-containing protein n=1 Tax=Falco tinnunculus TaxID=100819 RepID=A0A8C4U1D8_FALTI
GRSGLGGICLMGLSCFSSRPPLPPHGGLLTNMRCKCIKSTAQIINLGLILAIDVTPPGIHCRRKEVILTLKKNKKVCVAPEAPWIQLLIHKLTQRYATPSSQKNQAAYQTRWQDGPLSS